MGNIFAQRLPADLSLGAGEERNVNSMCMPMLKFIYRWKGGKRRLEVSTTSNSFRNGFYDFLKS